MSFAEHTNHEYSGHCCPHCMESNEYPSAEYDSTPTTVTCHSCGKDFLAWGEQVWENKSSFIEEDDEEAA